jgi:hypothetical protein
MWLLPLSTYLIEIHHWENHGSNVSSFTTKTKNDGILETCSLWWCTHLKKHVHMKIPVLIFIQLPGIPCRLLVMFANTYKSVCQLAIARAACSCGVLSRHKLLKQTHQMITVLPRITTEKTAPADQCCQSFERCVTKPPKYYATQANGLLCYFCTKCFGDII